VESRLPYVQDLIERVGIENLTKLEVEAVRTRPIPDRLIRDLRDAGDPDHDLTQAQIEIVALTAHGLTKPEIARLTDRSLDTVKTHMRRVHERLDCHNQAQMVVRAIQLGYLRV